MKIAFVFDDTLDSTDGVQQYILTLGSWMKQNGHEVYYIVGQTKRSDIANIYSITKNVKVSFNKNKLSIPLPTRTVKIKQLFLQEHFDVIHVQVPYSPFMAAKVIRIAHNHNIAVVGTFHILPFSKKEQYATKILSRVLRRTNGYFDEFIAVSEPARLFAADHFGIHSTVIPNPVVLPNMPSKGSYKNSRVKTLVFLGRLVQRKGPLELLKVFNLVIKKYPLLHLDMYGDGPLRNKIEAYIDQHNLSAQVTLHGYISEAKKYEVLGQADLAIFPSIGGESFGIVLIEAIASGAGVVLGGNNPGYASVLQDEHTLFNPRNQQEFLNCIQRYIEKPDLLRVVHSKQEQLINAYVVDVVAPQVIQTYKDAIASRHQSAHNI